MTKIKVLKNKKGFTLIELIVVMAILAVLAAIAIPKFSTMRLAATVNADASTYSQILNAMRVQETQTGTELDKIGDLKSTYMAVTPTTLQTAGTLTQAEVNALTVDGGGDAPYEIKFTPVAAFSPYNKEQTVTEHVKFVLKD